MTEVAVVGEAAAAADDRGGVGTGSSTRRAESRIGSDAPTGPSHPGAMVMPIDRGMRTAFRDPGTDMLTSHSWVNNPNASAHVRAQLSMVRMVGCTAVDGYMLTITAFERADGDISLSSPPPTPSLIQMRSPNIR